MRFLWIATKAPWPPRDGGRLALWSTIQALREAGHTIELVAPHWGAERDRVEAEGQIGAWCDVHLIPWRPRSTALSWLLAIGSGMPWTIERHRSRAVRRCVEERLRGEPRDAVVAEQMQATPQIPGPGFFAGARRAMPLSILRAQNVESELWAGQARTTGGVLGPWLRAEARRVHRAEREIVRRVDGVAAITERDADAFRFLVGADRVPSHVGHLPVPFAAELDPAPQPLRGSPTVVLLGSAGWRPNQGAAVNFLDRIWPAVRRALPEARLHAFGLDTRFATVRAEALAGAGIDFHPAPAESRDCFPPGALLAAPLAVASGVRMKILEAWARGVPAVASPVAAAGLDAESPRALAIADTPAEWVAALVELHRSKDLRAARIAAGRAILRRVHAPERVAARWVDFVHSLRR